VNDRDARDFPLQDRPATEREKAQRDRRASLASDYHAAFTAYPQVLRDIQQEGFVNGSTVAQVDSVVDQAQTLVNEGRRQLALHIMRMAQQGLLEATDGR
jgi:hypothetical protein